MRILCWIVGLLLLSNNISALEVQRWETEKGARVMYVHAPQLPIVDVRVVFDAGSARDGALPGIARLFNALLSEGAGEWDADELAQRLESRGIEISQQTGRDMAWVSMRSLSDKAVLTLALDTLATMLSRPRLDQAAINRVRQRTLAEIHLEQQSAGSLGRRVMLQKLFGQHPYAHDPKGDESSLAAISPLHLKAFQEKYYVASNATIAIVGNIDRAQAEMVAKRLLSGLPQGEKAAALPEPEPPKAAISKESFPASQTHLFMGMLGVNYKDEAYFPLLLGNHVLGGSGLTSILGEEVRNKRGLSYGVSSAFSPLRSRGAWIMSAQTRNDQANATMKLMLKLLRRFLRDGPSKEQLEAARKNLVGGFPLTLSSNKKILQQITLMGFYDLPLNWLDVYTTRLEQIDVKQVRNAFRQRMSLKSLIQVFVGGAK